MKYYILGNLNKKSKITMKMSQAFAEFDNIDTALKKYYKCIDEGRFYNCYLIVDFEIEPGSVFRSTTLDDNYSDRLPFLVIGSWRVGESKEYDVIRADHTFIEKHGYTHSFSNNYIAVKEFERCCVDEIEAEFFITYCCVDEMGDHIFTRKMADIYEVNGKAKPLRKITIDNLNKWIFVPVPERKLSIYTLTPREENHDTVVTTIGSDSPLHFVDNPAPIYESASSSFADEMEKYYDRALYADGEDDSAMFIGNKQVVASSL